MTITQLGPLPLAHVRRGKVREVYAVGDDRLLLVATDRVSAFDVVMNEAIPHKGAVLTQLTAWWLRHLEKEIHHHMLSANVDEIINVIPSLEEHRAMLAGRTMLCHKTEVYPIECVIRGYLSGSAWKEYSAAGTLAGEQLAPDLRESERLEPPIFSPATKAESGHDENITIAKVVEALGPTVAAELEHLARAIYERGRGIAAQRGIIIADTKFEFGFIGEQLVLADEVLTPDSSRFWPRASYQPGGPQASYDKQYVRDYLESIHWNKQPPAPALPFDVVERTSEKYREAYRVLTGKPL